MKITAIQKLKIHAVSDNITQFHRDHPGSRVIEIDGKKADEVCESCEKAITNGDECFVWNDMVYTCLECGGANSDHLPQILETGVGGVDD